MELQYRTLRIRNAEIRDAALLAAWWNDGGVMAHAGFPLGLGTTPERIVKQLSEDNDETGRRLILERDGLPVGEANYRAADGQAAEIGIKICIPDEQNRGQGKIFLSLLIEELFAQGYAYIVLDTDRRNARARHVYEQLGFRLAAIREHTWRDQLGEWRDAADYVLKPENFVDYTKRI